MGPSPVSPPPYPTRQIPSTIGRIEIVCQLGEGGMARVFLGIQRGAFDVTKLVVVKQVRPEFSGDDEFLAMFVNEARLALRFNHSNVVHTYEIIAEAPDYCLVMEYLEGQTLSQLLRRVGRESFPLREHVWILSQVLAGLSYAHELKDFDGTPLGVVHRDVSPSNVLITTKGEVKLLDFGIAKASGAISRTRHGMMKGKLGYAAPEQCLAKSSDARSDIYAIGVMLWEAIAGQRRMFGESELAALRARVDGAEPPIEQVIPNVPDELAEACRRSLALDPAQRFDNALEFQKCLEAYLTRSTLQDPATRLADMVRHHFEPELAYVRQSIEARVGSSVRVPGRLTADGSSMSPGPIARTLSGVEPEPSISIIAVASNRRRTTTAAVGAAAAIAAVAAALALARNDPPSVPATGATLASPVATQAAALPQAPPSVPPPAQENIRVRIAVQPANAKLRLDGRLVTNPFVAEMPASTQSHELVAGLEGHVTAVRHLRLDRDVDVELTLDGLSPANARGRALQPDARRGRSARGVAATTSAERAASSPEVPSTLAPSPSQPGADLARMPERTPRSIDERDPYTP